MNYTEYRVEVNEEQGEIILALLSDMGFDSFVYDDGAQLCYIEEGELAKFKDQIESYLDDTGYCYSSKQIVTQNWNAEWESDFEPIVVDDRLCVRALHHPKSNCQNEVIITPNMSFGTGHHATTYQMIEAILEGDFERKNVLDVGCGSAILSIVAAQRGASRVVGVDIDSWAVQSAAQNVEQNGINQKIELLTGDVSVVEGQKFDIVLANINRNILCENMPYYGKVLRAKGLLYCSGFYEADIEAIADCAAKNGFELKYSTLKDSWATLTFVNS